MPLSGIHLQSPFKAHKENIVSATQKHVYLFSDLDQAEAYAQGDWDSTRGLLGGKGEESLKRFCFRIDFMTSGD